jgi:hypothetical protein
MRACMCQLCQILPERPWLSEESIPFSEEKKCLDIYSVGATIRMVDPSVALTAVRASRGKVTRAEPASSLYEQGRIHHVGTFPQLEDQMANFTADFDRAAAGYSPDRVDALVWAITDLLVEQMKGWAIFELARRQYEAKSAAQASREYTANSLDEF